MAQSECLASEFALRKIALQKKKSLKLKLHANSDYRLDEIFIFKKKLKQLLSEQCEKILIKSISLQKRNIYCNVSQSVASLFGVFYTDTNFLPKLRKCCYEVIVDKC